MVPLRRRADTELARPAYRPQGLAPSHHPWLRIERLIRSNLEVRRDEVTRPVMKATLTKALKEREKIRRAGWMN